MDITTLTFGIKDVIAIVAGTLTVGGFIYTIKLTTEKVTSKVTDLTSKLESLKSETAEKFMHAKNSKKANIEMIYEDIKQVQTSLKEKEVGIYNKITEIKTEQKAEHDKLSTQMGVMSTQLTAISTNMAELTGYIKAKKEN